MLTQRLGLWANDKILYYADNVIGMVLFSELGVNYTALQSQNAVFAHS